MDSLQTRSGGQCRACGSGTWWGIIYGCTVKAEASIWDRGCLRYHFLSLKNVCQALKFLLEGCAVFTSPCPHSPLDFDFKAHLIRKWSLCPAPWIWAGQVTCIDRIGYVPALILDSREHAPSILSEVCPLPGEGARPAHERKSGHIQETQMCHMRPSQTSQQPHQLPEANESSLHCWPTQSLAKVTS